MNQRSCLLMELIVVKITRQKLPIRTSLLLPQTLPDAKQRISRQISCSQMMDRSSSSVRRGMHQRAAIISSRLVSVVFHFPGTNVRIAHTETSAIRRCSTKPACCFFQGRPLNGRKASDK